MSFQLTFDPNLLLVQDQFAVLLIRNHRLALIRTRLDGHQLGLLLDPFLLHLKRLGGTVCDLLSQILDLRLQGPSGIVFLLGHLLSVLPIQPVHVELLLLNLMKTLSNLQLVLVNQFLPVSQVLGELFESVLQHLVVPLGIQGIHLDTSNFIQQILELHLLLIDVGANLPSYLPGVVLRALDCRLVGDDIVDLVVEGCCLSRHLLDSFFHQFQRCLLFLDTDVKLRGLFLGVLQGFLQHAILLSQLFSLRPNLLHLTLKMLHLGLILLEQPGQLLVVLLLLADRILDSPDLTVESHLVL
mmetsp:Transcript_1730/g.3766  ORF Transcript_1730/g.3766 Transcript_1730/m.3766 type:complete len:299 (+) Transcript_1730:1232-2128(+)